GTVPGCVKFFQTVRKLRAANFQWEFQANFRGLWSIRARKISRDRPLRGDFDSDREFSHSLLYFCTARNERLPVELALSELVSGTTAPGATPRLQPKPAFSRFPPVHRVDLEGQQRVELTRSPCRRGMAAMCAIRPFKL